MEFHLIYKGKLPSGQSTGSVKTKHAIRKIFHKQLAELWRLDPRLSNFATGRFVLARTPSNLVSDPGPNEMFLYKTDKDDSRGRSWVQIVGDEYARDGFRFVPLARKQNGFTCGLDILFLRRGNPGDVVVSGDLDNRLKTLFDSLRIPSKDESIGNPDTNEKPFFCLLEDDSLITSVTVTADRLLTPIETGDSEKDVEVVLHVKIVDPGALLGDTGTI